MKKYNIFDLKVVKVKKDGLEYYFICIQSVFPNKLIEIFTGKIIDKKDILHIESFANYYSIISRFNYTTREPLKVTKQELIEKFININSQLRAKNKNSINKLDSNIKEILKQATIDFFPKTGTWTNGCFSNKKDSLLKNLRNNYWLAIKLKEKCNLSSINLEDILVFVSESDYFNQQRHVYEQKVVKWQIEWMLNNREGWLVDEQYGGDFIIFNENCDIGFRKAIVDTLIAIGIDLEAIEEGIEKNANLWREKLMLMAFKNTYEPIWLMSNMEQPSEEYKKNWIKVRLYEYYQQNRKSVDSYGIIAPEMKMSELEVFKLNCYLEEKNKERMQYLEELESKNTAKKLIKKDV